MPKNIERVLARKIRAFTWNEKKAPVAGHILFAPRDEGGRDLLDIVSRNEAIGVMWLKAYLNLGPERPLWAWVADALLARNVPTSELHVDPRARINIFLQSWKSTKSRSGACKDLRDLQRTAVAFGVRADGLFICKSILRKRPIWYHSEANRKIRYLNKGVSMCLKEKHRILLVGEAESLARLLDTPGHRPTNECECRECNKVEEDTGCLTPHSCAKRAKELLDTLPPKWDPRRVHPAQISTENPRQRTPGEDEDPDWVPFEGRMVTTGNLAEVFQIFTVGRNQTTYPSSGL
ncbi:hypothetical protein C0992_007522 [Termitomyces sp. T32_za158]|nr:hypothetical protein C0992_007522 [Termitomyces sp. T32_za158]